MNAKTVFRTTAAALLAAMLGACGSTLQAGPEPVVPVTRSVEQADERLAAVAREKAAIEARFAEREQVCYQKFFMNNCLDEAKERRRLEHAAQHAIEIEAARFKRQAKVDERDREMAKAEQEAQAQEARMAARPALAPSKAGAPPPPKRKPVANRVARHNEKLRQAEERDKAEAGQRAANVAAFERRKRESEQRQKDVAARLAERAAEAEREKQKAATPAR